MRHDRSAVAPQSGTGSKRPSPVAVAGCLALGVVGAIVTLGCLLSIYLESVGLGAPRDGGMRPGYTALLIAGALAGVLLPAAACFVFLVASRRVVVGLAALGAAIVTAAVLGITWM